MAAADGTAYLFGSGAERTQRNHRTAGFPGARPPEQT
jgi:hypothetical protein